MAPSGKHIKRDPVVIYANLPDIQSSSSCAKLIKEIIKYIVCQKKQIPYPYEHLEYIARNARNGMESNNKISISKYKSRDNLKRKTHYRKAAEAFEALEKIFQNIDAELRSSDSGVVEEISVLLGATPVSPKEVYRILLPTVNNDCVEKQPSSKSLIQLIRCIIVSEDLHELISKPVSPTNTFVFLKKQAGLKCQWFLPKDYYSLPTRGHEVIFCLSSAQGKKHEVNTIDSQITTIVSGTHDTDLISSDMRKTNGYFPIYQDESGVINMGSVLVTRPDIRAKESAMNGVDLNTTIILSDKCNIDQNPVENSIAKDYSSIYVDVVNVELKGSESQSDNSNNTIFANTSHCVEKSGKFHGTVHKTQWYQSQVSVKGYKNIMSKKTSNVDFLVNI